MKKKIKTQKRIGIAILIACVVLAQLCKHWGVSDITGIVFVAVIFGCPLTFSKTVILK